MKISAEKFYHKLVGWEEKKKVDGGGMPASLMPRFQGAGLAAMLKHFDPRSLFIEDHECLGNPVYR